MTRVCAHKIRYKDKVQAQAALAQLPPGRNEKRAYWCLDCQGWHLTSQEA